MIQRIQELESNYGYVERIIRALSSNGDGPEIIDRLRNGESYQSIATELGDSSLGDLADLSPKSQNYFSLAIKEYDKDASAESGPASGPFKGGRWTTVTSDEALIDHLLALYFTWVHPMHMLFSRPHFLASYNNRVDVYCTAALVNAICAMACHLFDNVPGEHFQTSLDPGELSGKFLQEARSLIQGNRVGKLAVVQTYAVMFLVELSAGKGANSTSYIRVAADAIDQRIEAGYSTQAAEMTRWGIYSLSVDWAQFTFQVPTLFQIPPSLEIRPFGIIQDMEPWQLYRHLSDQAQPERQSFIILTASAHAKLLRIIHDTLALFYHSHEGSVSARELMVQYERYIVWKDNLPDEIAMANAETHQLPHVIALHVQYQTAVIQLFRPLLDFRQLSAEAFDHVRSLVLSYAWTGLDLFKTYQELYTGRFQHALQAYSLLHIADALIRFDRFPPESGTKVVQFTMKLLREMADGRCGFAASGPLQEAFRQAAVECHIPLPDDIDSLMKRTSPPPGFDGIINATTRLSYIQPVTQPIRSFNSSFALELEDEWRRFAEGDSTSESPVEDRLGVMKINALLNG
ncbi:hypothetical protein MMC13_003500 [Lambiella insularis]|nr:hypothetical protein [Lambiella insularis]